MLEHPSTSVVQNPTLPKLFGDNMIGADNQQGSPLDGPSEKMLKQVKHFCTSPSKIQDFAKGQIFYNLGKS